VDRQNPCPRAFYLRARALRLLVMCSLVVPSSAIRARVWAADDHPKYTGTIIIGLPGDQTQIAGYEALAAAYNEHQPNVTIKVELSGGAFGGAGGYSTWLNTQLASGEPRPDIVSGNYSKTYAHFVSLDYYRHCTNPYTGNRWEEDLDFDFCVERNNMGQHTMAPTQAVHIQWFYNKDIFERLGLAIPRTWREFVAVCGKIKAAGIVPTTLRFDYRYHQWLAEILWDQYSRPQFQYTRALPGDWCFNPEVDGAWEYDPQDPFNDVAPTRNKMRFYRAIRDGLIRFDTPEFAQCLENLKAIAQYGPPDFLIEQAGTGADAYSLFLRQEAAIHLDGTWLLPLIDEDMAELRDRPERRARKLKPFRWGFFDTPPQTNPLVVGAIRSIESASGEYVSIIHKNQPQTDMVIDFVMFWLSAPGYQTFVDAQVAADEFRPAGKIMVRGVRIPERYKALDEVDMIGNAENSTNILFLLPPAGSRLSQDGRQALVEFIRDRIDVAEAARRIQAMAKASVEANMERNNLPMTLLDRPELDPRQYQ